MPVTPVGTPIVRERPPGRPAWLAIGAAMLLGIGGWSAHAVGAERDALRHTARALTNGGDARRGPELMRRYGCATCHTVPGVDGATGGVGPPLGGIAQRSYIGGVLPNTPENLMQWIRDPKLVDSLTAMPNVGVSEVDARHIAAYLYTLR
jgi:cytochrome c